jgi:nudix-type nucleoside diphosphatase (YffH/AdpP family)
MRKDIKIESVTPLARYWGRLDRYSVSHDKRDGTRQTVEREVYDHGNAAAVLLYSADTHTVVLTRQLRFPAHLNGDDAYLIEVPAGLLDGDEAPETAAYRESIEETGYAPQDLELISYAYMSPGSLTEKCACFLGRYRPGQKHAAGGGLESEGEDIEVFELDFDQALAGIHNGTILDGKTVILLQALALRLAGAAKR